MTGVCPTIQNAVLTTSSTAEATFFLLETLTIEQRKIFAATLWSLWKYRNSNVWEDVSEVYVTVSERARAMVDDWQLTNVTRSANHSSLQNAQQDHSAVQRAATASAAGHAFSATPVSWQKPSIGRVKCKIDAAFSSTQTQTGIGICIRDAEGDFVFVKTVSSPSVYRVEVGEAFGLFEGLQWLSDMSFDIIDFEINSKIARDAFQSR